MADVCSLGTIGRMSLIKYLISEGGGGRRAVKEKGRGGRDGDWRGRGGKVMVC